MPETADVCVCVITPIGTLRCSPQTAGDEDHSAVLADFVGLPVRVSLVNAFSETVHATSKTSLKTATVGLTI